MPLQPINNAIVAAGGGANLLSTQYTNTANAFDVTFSGSGTPEISITYGEAGITFVPVNATGSGNMHMTASASAIAIGGVENCATLSQLTATGSNTATYANAFGTADLVYVLENDALKEYIILEDSAAPNSYNFLFTLDGVTLQEMDTGAAFLNEAGEAVFYLGGLFAVDANGVPTDDLTYTFQTVKNNIIGVTITLDPEYLVAADRAFPVVIDPTIMISSSSTADACVCSYTPSTNYQMATQLRTGFCTDYGIRRSYIRFSIPDSIEVGGVISAYLDIEKISGVAPTMRAYRVTGSWSSGTITWNNKPGYTTTHQSTQSVPYSSGSSWYRMNVTSIVNAWVNGEYINYGFALVDSVENDSDHWTTLYSSDADSPHKPELYITYSGDSTPTTPTTPTFPTTPTTGITSGQTYFIKNTYSGKYLEADESLNNNVVQNSFDGNSNQQWKVVYQGNGVYKLYNQYAGYVSGRCCLDLTSASGSNIDLYSDSSAARVLFYIIANGDGTFRIQNSWTGTTAVLTVADAASLSDVSNSSWTSSSKQEWSFELATTKLSGYKTFSAFDIGDSTQDEVALVESSMSSFGFKNVGVYDNSNYYVPAQAIKDIGLYSDIVYINGHGGSYANLWVQDSSGTTIEYLCADSTVNINGTKVGIGATWKSGSSTKTTSYWNAKTKWLILAQCSQLNYGTQGAGNHWNGLNSAQVWARTMLGDGARMHGILGYYNSAPPADVHLDRLESFFQQATYSPLVTAWKGAHDTLTGRTNWAMLYHDANISDTLNSFTSNTANGSSYTIYLVSDADGDNLLDLTSSKSSDIEMVLSDSIAYPILMDVSSSQLSSSNYSKMKNNLQLEDDTCLQVDENERITYTNLDFNIGDENLNFTLSDAEATMLAKKVLAELELLPEDSYRTSVSEIQRQKLDLDGNPIGNPEIIEYSVKFYRTYNGVDVISDKEDGIIVTLNKNGISELKYLWREMDVVQDTLVPSTESLLTNQNNPITAEQALKIYQSEAETLFSGEITDPVITTAYLQRGNTVRPVWVFSTSEGYVNSVYIDMYTGELLTV